jgi:hypothetical protein
MLHFHNIPPETPVLVIPDTQFFGLMAPTGGNSNLYDLGVKSFHSVRPIQ